MKVRLYIGGVICLLILVSCGEKYLTSRDYFFSIKNDSGHTISAYYQQFDYMPSYPDTTVANEGYQWSRHRFPSGLSVTWYYSSRYVSRKKVVRDMVHEFSPSDTVSFFVFHSDTLDKYDWKTVMEKYLIIVRYDLTADYFLQHDTVWFPPTVEMRDVKMWPPYEDIIAKYTK